MQGSSTQQATTDVKLNEDGGGGGGEDALHLQPPMEAPVGTIPRVIRQFPIMSLKL